MAISVTIEVVKHSFEELAVHVAAWILLPYTIQFNTHASSCGRRTALGSKFTCNQGSTVAARNSV